MNLNWSNKVIKYVLFVFNLLFVISGIIMIAVGVSVKAYFTDYDIFLNDKYFSLPNLLIAIGSLIFFISFFGCCGAIRENWFMIFIFSILLSLIFIMEFSAGIAGYVLRDNTVSYLEESLKTAMDSYQFNPSASNITANSQTKMWDLIQETFECCGINGPNDWPSHHHIVTTSTTTTTTTTTTIAPTTTTTSSSQAPPSSPSSPTAATAKRAALVAEMNSDLPSSCCKSKSGASGTTTCNLDDQTTATYYKRGCTTEFGNYLKDHAVTLGGVGIAIAFIQLFGVIFACHLTKQLKNGFYST